MNNIEAEAINLAKDALAQIPKDGIKSINLYWECISSDCLPNLTVNYKDDKKVEPSNTTSSTTVCTTLNNLKVQMYKMLLDLSPDKMSGLEIDLLATLAEETIIQSIFEKAKQEK